MNSLFALLPALLWLCLAAVVFTYAGYPVLIFVLARLFGRRRRRPALDPDDLPSVSLLIAAHNEAQDYELLGLCQVRVDDEAGARASFQKGLDLERARDPQSPLCGQLMKWVASV